MTFKGADFLKVAEELCKLPPSEYDEAISAKIDNYKPFSDRAVEQARKALQALERVRAK